MKLILSAVLIFTQISTAQINWFTIGSGANNEVFDIYSDSSGIYFAGYFTQIAGVQANSIAKWDGKQWQTFPNNFPQVKCVSSNGSEIFVGASADTFNGVFRWNGTQWDTIGILPSGYISTITFDDSSLYAGGFFNSISGVEAYSAARWDGAQWHAMGNDFQAEEISSLIIYRNQLYAGGTFIRSAKNLFHIARWQDTSWVSVSGGTNLPVISMYAYNDTLYVAGQFSQVGNFSGGSGIAASRIARWDGDNWSAIGQGLSGLPIDLIVRQSFIYAVGNFSGANPPFEVIYKWDGLNWNLLATASGYFANISFFEPTNSFYVGGNFTSVSTLGNANNLVRFVDSSVITTLTENVFEATNPTDIILYQNYPNPYNPATKIRYSIPRSTEYHSVLQKVILKIYDVLGNEVATLVDEERPAGTYEVEFNGHSDGGQNLSSGIYFYQLKAGSFIETKKMILIR